MLRIRHKACCVHTQTLSIKPLTKKAHRSESLSRVHSELDVVKKPEFSPLSRYVPSASKSFLVEEHRLTDGEKVTQRISSVLPWLIFGSLAITPFLVMKYNLSRISDVGRPSNLPENSSIATARHKFATFTTADIPELLARRTPTLICLISENYHSRVMSNLFEELDTIFDNFGIKVNVSLVRMSSDDDPKMVALAPHCQLIVPKAGDGVIYPFSGPWNLEEIIRFVLPEAKITAQMRQSIQEAHERLSHIQKSMFKKCFVDPR